MSITDRVATVKNVMKAQDERDKNSASVSLSEDGPIRRSKDEELAYKRYLGELDGALGDNQEEAAAKIRKVMNNLASITHNTTDAKRAELDVAERLQTAAKNYVEDLTTICSRFHVKMTAATGSEYDCSLSSRLELAEHGLLSLPANYVRELKEEDQVDPTSPVEEELTPPATDGSFAVVDNPAPPEKKLPLVKRDPREDPNDLRYSPRIAPVDDPRSSDYAPTGVELRAAAKWAIGEKYEAKNWLEAAIVWGCKTPSDRQAIIEWSVNDDDHRLYNQGRNSENCAKYVNKKKREREEEEKNCESEKNFKQMFESERDRIKVEAAWEKLKVEEADRNRKMKEEKEHNSARGSADDFKDDRRFNRGPTVPTGVWLGKDSASQGTPDEGGTMTRGENSNKSNWGDWSGRKQTSRPGNHDDRRAREELEEKRRQEKFEIVSRIERNKIPPKPTVVPGENYDYRAIPTIEGWVPAHCRQFANYGSDNPRHASASERSRGNQNVGG